MKLARNGKKLLTSQQVLISTHFSFGFVPIIFTLDFNYIFFTNKDDKCDIMTFTHRRLHVKGHNCSS